MPKVVSNFRDELSTDRYLSTVLISTVEAKINATLSHL